MAVNTFAITAADIQGRVQGLLINSTTSPTEDQVDNIILLSAAEVETEAAAVGINTQILTDTTDATYLVVKNMIVYKTVSEVMVARNKGQISAGEYWDTKYKQLLETLRKRPLSIEPDRGEGTDVAYSLDLNADNVFNIDFYRSISGKIVLGGL